MIFKDGTHKVFLDLVSIVREAYLDGYTDGAHADPRVESDVSNWELSYSKEKLEKIIEKL